MSIYVFFLLLIMLFSPFIPYQHASLTNHTGSIRIQGIGPGMSICRITPTAFAPTWWRHQMETFSALLAICAGNSPVPVNSPHKRPVTRSFDVYFDLRPNKRLSKQSRGWWFDTPSRPLWRHRNEMERTPRWPLLLALAPWRWCDGFASNFPCIMVSI